MHNTLPPNAADYFKTPAKTTPEHAHLRSVFPAILMDASDIVLGPTSDRHSVKEWKRKMLDVAKEIVELAS